MSEEWPIGAFFVKSAKLEVLNSQRAGASHNMRIDLTSSDFRLLRLWTSFRSFSSFRCFDFQITSVKITEVVFGVSDHKMLQCYTLLLSNYCAVSVSGLASLMACHLNLHLGDTILRHRACNATTNTFSGKSTVIPQHRRLRIGVGILGQLPSNDVSPGLPALCEVIHHRISRFVRFLFSCFEFLLQ